MTTITKKITFENAMKEFKKYVSNDKSRPILHYVYFDGENFIATDSHVLLKVNKSCVSEIPLQITDGVLINPSTLEIVADSDLKYPDTSRIFPQYCNLNIRLNGSLDEIRSYIREDNKLLKGKAENKLFNFITHGDYIELRAINIVDGEKIEKSQHIMKHRFVLENVEDEQYKTYLRSIYITNALTTTKKLSKLSKDDIQFKVVNGIRPITIEQSNVFSILLMPVRIS